MEPPLGTYRSIFPTQIAEFDLRSVFDPAVVTDMIKTNLDQATEKDREWGLFPGADCTYSYNRGILHLPGLGILRSAIMYSINEYCKQSGFHQQTIKESWTNVGYKGSTVKNHKHSSCAISATYYPHFPKGSGDLILTRQMPEIKGKYDLPCVTSEETIFNESEHEMKIKEGHLYVWPAWMYHKSGPNLTDQRCVVGINTINKE